ncbi:MAG: cytochrome c3 family protein [Desulfobacterium sp.]|nr:cytochrome c3 family protein [Desulfobacterium sp.]MBU3946932.1 cytochrome c3 family protein [Pseudomonadota bacterium]MBU4010677.1 cytochrome c3 family protein [Pseudomonadota bacterium]MBU4036248.1 cytochrome c3 family protein [Pseudomonadota bacterium]
MKQSIKVPVVIIVLLTLFMIINLPTPAVSGAEKLPKINKHKEKEIACESCHEKGSLYARPGDDTCMNCHDSYAKLAEKTAKLENIKAGIENPHKSHMGEARCTLCHKNHASSILYCNECHSPKFDMKVP